MIEQYRYSKSFRRKIKRLACKCLKSSKGRLKYHKFLNNKSQDKGLIFSYKDELSLSEF